MGNTNAPNQEISSQIQQVTSANPDGEIFGQSASDKINFYGRIPMPQRVVANVSLLTSSTATGTASSWGYYSSSQSGTASTYYMSSFVQSAYATATVGSVLSDVVNTLVGLGIWKAASV